MIVLNILSFPAHFRLNISLQINSRFSDHVAKYSPIWRSKWTFYNRYLLKNNINYFR